MGQVDLAIVDQMVCRIGADQHKLLELLHAVQEHFGYLPTEALERLCQLTRISPAEIWGVASFYDRFRRVPAGRHTVHVCVGTACHVKGGELVYEAFRRYLGIPEGRDTDQKMQFTVMKVACLGCCTLAPAVQIDGITYGHLTSESVGQVIEDFLQRKAAGRAEPAKGQRTAGEAKAEIRIGLGSCCQARGSARLKQALEQVLGRYGLDVPIKMVGCVGMCHQTPLLELIVAGKSFLYARVQPQDVEEIVSRHLRLPGRRARLLASIAGRLERMVAGPPNGHGRADLLDREDRLVKDFLANQIRITTECSGQIDPLDIDEYVNAGGFAGLQRCLQALSPEDVIEQIRISGLRGRGGAGFPTHAKWSAVRSQPGTPKYVICNGDEGDPGAFMDRMLMESYPFRIIEGLAIAAWCVGADEGFFYIRAEYPLALQRIQRAIDICTQRGYLGDSIMGTGFRLRLRIIPGAGAFVCGEETAMIASIEGRRGHPRFRPPYPAQHGLWGRPTLINNVETLATVPWIVRNGGQAYAAIGTQSSKGTKVFALAGKVARGGLIEVPMGIRIRQIVEQIGGGCAEGRRFKAVQVGGPSGGCIPEQMDWLPVDYETLTQAGAMMGSGGFVVLDEGDCMVDMARYFLQFTQNQSCGKCTFCRIGTRRMLEILDAICQGQGKEQDLQQLQSLAEMVQKASLCGLGKTAPKPVLTSLRYFRSEYLAHLEGRCPAGRCRALIRYVITERCIGCTLCAQHCPSGAIAWTPYQVHQIDQTKCIRCGTCKAVCPSDAVRIQ